MVDVLFNNSKTFKQLSSIISNAATLVMQNQLEIFTGCIYLSMVNAFLLNPSTFDIEQVN